MKELKFQSEELLRQVVVKLLMRIPNVRDVQLLHGSQEYGKDIVFWTNGPLGEPVPCACVIKNTRIGGSVDKRSDARSVLIQIQQALDTPFTDHQGQEQKIQRVYAISPEPISQAAMNSIKGCLKNLSGGIVFIPGEKLFDLFRTFWPDYFADEFAILEQHLQSLSEVTISDEIREVANIYGMPAPTETEKTIYVTRQLHRILLLISDDYLFRPVPDAQALQGKWTDVNLQRRIDFLEKLAKSLPHLNSWSFLDRSLLTKGSSTMEGAMIGHLQNMILTLARHLRSALIEAQGRHAINSAEGENRSAPSEYELLLPTEIISKAEKLRMMTINLIAPLRNAYRRPSSTRNCSDVQAFQRDDVRSQARLTDCIISAPVRLFDLKESLVYKVRETDLRDSTVSWFIVGPAGYGKTAFCRWNALLDAENYRGGTSKIFPIYVPLNVLSRHELKDYKNAFLRTAGHSALLPEEFQRIDKQSQVRIRLYLDGLDEVPTLSQRVQIAELARSAHSDGIQIFLTARDYIVMPQLDWLIRMNLQALDESEQLELISKVLESAAEIVEFRRQLSSSGSMGELLEAPLLARLIMLVYRQTGELPENRPKLYSTFIDLLSGGWDLAKGLLRQSRFGRVIKRLALCKLAGIAHEKRNRYFRASTVTEALRSTANAMSDREISALFFELLRDGLLARSADMFYFSHLSFQEFLCALYYFGSQDRHGIEVALKEFLNGDDWWREVIKFYIGLSENPAELARWLAVKLHPLPDERRAAELWSTFKSTYPLFKREL